MKIGIPQHYSYQAQQVPQPYVQQQYYQAQYQQPVQQQAPIQQQQPMMPQQQQPVYHDQAGLPPIPPLQQQQQQNTMPPTMSQPYVPAPTQQAAPPAPQQEYYQPQVETAPAAPTFSAPVETPEQTAQQNAASSRDMLLAKAKAYREQALKQREGTPEQLSMEMNLDHKEQKGAAVDLSSPFDQTNLDVPTYLRRKQRSEDSPDAP